MKIQIAKQIYINTLSITKKILDLGEFKLGKKSDDFKYFREQVFNHTYEELRKLFKTLETNKIIKRCKNKCSLRKGYSDCSCGGSGYIGFDNK